MVSKLRKDKRLNRQDKALIEEMYRGFTGGMGKRCRIWKPGWRACSEPGGRRQIPDAFKEFRVEPPKEQRDIRKVYLRLSKQFHAPTAPATKGSGAVRISFSSS